MRRNRKALLSAALALSLLGSACVFPAAAASPAVDAGSAVLMEKETGTVLYQENGDVQREPASVTKVMTLLLILEAVDAGRLSYDDSIPVSAAAAGMGGSQVYLKEGESMTLDDMLKAICLASANDACVAVAEYLCGSEEAFVEKMNQRAAELGMTNTHFVNCTGLPAKGHLTTAVDIALMSRALIAHKDIRKYTTIWMDTLRDGQFQLANTNKLIRYYEGATGLKTGSTDSAGFCLSATAERDGMELIAVVLKAPTSEKRFESAKALLNYGFANYPLVTAAPSEELTAVPVTLGERDSVAVELQESPSVLVSKNAGQGVTTQVALAESAEAPVEKGQTLGRMTVSVDGEIVRTVPIVAGEGVERLSLGGMFTRLAKGLFLAK